MSPEIKRGRVPTACSGGNHGDVCVDLGRAPAGVKPLEVRCAHPVRLSPATYSQGHGRPCLQRSRPSRGFSATWYCHLTVPYWAITYASPDSALLWRTLRKHCHGHVLPVLLAEPWCCVPMPLRCSCRKCCVSS